MTIKSVTLEEFTKLFDPPVGTKIEWAGYLFERGSASWIATGVLDEILSQHEGFVDMKVLDICETFPVSGTLPDGTSIVYDVPYKDLKRD